MKACLRLQLFHHPVQRTRVAKIRPRALRLVQNQKNGFNRDVPLTLKIICRELGWLPLGFITVAEAIPTLLVEKESENAINVSVVGGVVEPGWILQDTYNGDDWRDLKVLEGTPGRFALSSVPTSTRFFRATQKSLATHQEALTQARANWQALGLMNYQYRSKTSVSGFLTDDLTLVEGRRVKEWTSLLPPGFPGFSWGDQTVDNIFNRLQRAIDNNAHMIVARYHPHLGYPESAYVDQSELIADEEWGVSIIEAPANPEVARAAHESLWSRSGVKDYEFDLKYETTWLGWEGTIRVIDGSAEVVSGEVPSLWHIVMTIDELLAYIGATLAAGEVSSAAYDRELGIPQFFSRDWHLTIVDGPGERFWISGFHQL